MPQPKIIVNNLTKNFGEKQILKGVNLQIEKGQSLVILGGSGSGKSVCIKIIASLMASTSGNITIDGKNTTNLQGELACAGGTCEI